MWLRLTTAQFTTNIGTLNQWSISTSGSGFTYSGPSFWDKEDTTTAYSGTITILSGYTLNSISVSMGGTSLSNIVTDNGDGTHTINIASVTGDITITVSTTGSSSGGGGGEEDDSGLPEGYTALPTTKYALGVTSTGTGRVSANNAKRFSTADDTVANGILIPNGKTLHLIGLASGTYPLRLDYIYCTGNVTCPASGSTTAIEGLVGTASNYESANYFPLNKTGVDTIDIANNYGADYYFWFGFAGQTLNEGILAAYDTYTLGYKID